MSESARMMLQMLDENRSIEDIIKNTQKDSVKIEPKKDTTKKDVKKDEVKKETPKQDKNIDINTTNTDKKQ